MVSGRGLDSDLILDKANWVETYPVGRVCSHAGCETVLSMYNADDACELHRVPEPEWKWRGIWVTYCPYCGETRAVSAKHAGVHVCIKCMRKSELAKDIAAEEKTCTRCGRDLPLHEFCLAGNTKSGRGSRCRECDAARRRARRAGVRVRVTSPKGETEMELK